MDVYCVSNGNGWDICCRECANAFINNRGNPNDVSGPYVMGGGEADLIKHCDCGPKCINAIQTRSGPVGACFHNDLTLARIEYTIDALGNYIDNRHGVPEVLDLWAKEMRDYSLTAGKADLLLEYEAFRIKEKPGSFDHAIHSIPKDQLILTKSKKKHDNKVDSLMAFFDNRQAIGDAIYCESCKDTGVIILFNRSVECTDCSRSLKNAALEEVDIPF